MTIRFDHVAVNVKDVAASIEWYVKNLGANVVYRDDAWAYLEAAGVRIALTVRSQHPAHIAFDVGPNPPAEFVAKAKRHRDGSMSRYVTDPDGNAIEYIYYPEGADKRVLPQEG